MARQPGYKGIRKTPSREALLTAALDLMAEHGSSRVSIEDIVHKAGVAKGTFYNHFRDKDDLAHHVALGIRYDIRDQVAQLKIKSQDPAVHLTIALALFMHFATHSPAKARILVTMLADASDAAAPMNARLNAVLKAGQQSEVFSFRSLDSAVKYIIGLVVSGIFSILQKNETEGSTALINDLIIHGLIGLGVEPTEAATKARAVIEDIGLTDA